MCLRAETIVPEPPQLRIVPGEPAGSVERTRLLDDAWPRIVAALQAEASELVYGMWLAEIEPVGYVEHVLHLRAPDKKRDWVAERYGDLVARTARRVLGDETEVVFDKPPVAPKTVAEAAGSWKNLLYLDADELVRRLDDADVPLDDHELTKLILRIRTDNTTASSTDRD